MNTKREWEWYLVHTKLTSQCGLHHFLWGRTDRLTFTDDEADRLALVLDQAAQQSASYGLTVNIAITKMYAPQRIEYTADQTAQEGCRLVGHILMGDEHDLAVTVGFPVFPIVDTWDLMALRGWLAEAQLRRDWQRQALAAGWTGPDMIAQRPMPGWLEQQWTAQFDDDLPF